MVVNRRRKVVKYRGHTTHGGGHRKKRRGAGSRGGRGRAGSGKRAGHKVAGGLRLEPRRGFLPRRSNARKSAQVVNISYFTPVCIERLLAAGQAKKEGKVISIDLTLLGYTKLLGTGSVATALRLRIVEASPHAVERVVAAGGSVETSAETSGELKESS